MTKKVNISLAAELFDDYSEVVPVFGQGCNYITGYGVENMTIFIEACVEIDDDEKDEIEEKTFECQYESMARTCNIRAYNGIDLISSDYSE